MDKYRNEIIIKIWICPADHMVKIMLEDWSTLGSFFSVIVELYQNLPLKVYSPGHPQQLECNIRFLHRSAF